MGHIWFFEGTGWADKLRGVWDVGPGDKELTRNQNTLQIFKSWQQPPFGSSLEYIWCIHFFCNSVYVEAPFKACWLRNEWLQLVRVWQCGRLCGQLWRLRVWGCWKSQVFRLKVWLKWGGRGNVNKYWLPVTSQVFPQASSHRIVNKVWWSYLCFTE